MNWSLTPYRRRVLRAGAIASFIGGFIACSSAVANNNKVLHVTVTPAADNLDTPLDATPDPTGTQIYYLALSAGAPAVFKVPFAGGTPVTVFSGAPLVGPLGISISSDGNTLYIADPTAGTDSKGEIFSLPSSGGTPAPISGTADTKPTALDVATDGMADTLYFTGQDASGTATVYKIAPAGGTPTVVISGSPLSTLGGVSVGPDDTVYVSAGGGSTPGQVYAVKDGAATPLGPTIVPGTPAGIAVTLDGSRLLASSLDPKLGTSQVEVMLTNNTAFVSYNEVIKTNNVSGGIHRARTQDIYAWAGKTQVYAISIKPIAIASSTIGGVGVD